MHGDAPVPVVERLGVGKGLSKGVNKGEGVCEDEGCEGVGGDVKKHI